MRKFNQAAMQDVGDDTESDDLSEEPLSYNTISEDEEESDRC